jgi:hypothetical protein
MRPSCSATISLWAPSGVSYLVRAVFEDSSFMRRGDLEYIQTFNTNPAPIDLPPRCILALNERTNQRLNLPLILPQGPFTVKIRDIGDSTQRPPNFLVFETFVARPQERLRSRER